QISHSACSTSSKKCRPWVQVVARAGQACPSSSLNPGAIGVRPLSDAHDQPVLAPSNVTREMKLAQPSLNAAPAYSRCELDSLHSSTKSPSPESPKSKSTPLALRRSTWPSPSLSKQKLCHL